MTGVIPVKIIPCTESKAAPSLPVSDRKRFVILRNIALLLRTIKKYTTIAVGTFGENGRSREVKQKRSIEKGIPLFIIQLDTGPTFPITPPSPPAAKIHPREIAFQPCSILAKTGVSAKFVVPRRVNNAYSKTSIAQDELSLIYLKPSLHKLKTLRDEHCALFDFMQK